jgi:hypothetical protein
MIMKINAGISGARRNHFSRRALLGVRLAIARGRRVLVAPVSAVAAVIAVVLPSLRIGHFW